MLQGILSVESHEEQPQEVVVSREQRLEAELEYEQALIALEEAQFQLAQGETAIGLLADKVEKFRAVPVDQREAAAVVAQESLMSTVTLLGGDASAVQAGIEAKVSNEGISDPVEAAALSAEALMDSIKKSLTKVKDFIKKNWGKILLATAAIVGAAVFLPLAVASAKFALAVKSGTVLAAAGASVGVSAKTAGMIALTFGLLGTMDVIVGGMHIKAMIDSTKEVDSVVKSLLADIKSGDEKSIQSGLEKLAGIFDYKNPMYKGSVFEVVSGKIASDVAKDGEKVLAYEITSEDVKYVTSKVVDGKLEIKTGVQKVKVGDEVKVELDGKAYNKAKADEQKSAKQLKGIDKLIGKVSESVVKASEDLEKSEEVNDTQKDAMNALNKVIDVYTTKVVVGMNKTIAEIAKATNELGEKVGKEAEKGESKPSNEDNDSEQGQGEEKPEEGNTEPKGEEQKGEDK